MAIVSLSSIVLRRGRVKAAIAAISLPRVVVVLILVLVVEVGNVFEVFAFIRVAFTLLVFFGILINGDSTKVAIDSAYCRKERKDF